MDAESTSATAVLGGGCFWCLDAVFRELKGVRSVESGYAGGRMPNPTYEDVCGGDTGHAEVVRVTFDPDKITYDEILDKFWDMHDPTQVNRQGPDVGDQYRTVIFTHSPEQVAASEASKAGQQEKYRDPIATSIEPATGFWMAEGYHQCYFEQRRSGGLLDTLLGR